MIVAIVSMGAFGLAIGAGLAFARARLSADDDRIVDAIDALLPQTQCAQCGFPGCRPYAEAIAAGGALDLCPPGGQATASRIAELLGREAETPVVPEPQDQWARIDEDACIGCALCLEACPVDAIVGAHTYLHTVIGERCTGCELCVPPCPVDCISLLPRKKTTWNWPRPSP